MIVAGTIGELILKAMADYTCIELSGAIIVGNDNAKLVYVTDYKETFTITIVKETEE